MDPWGRCVAVMAHGFLIDENLSPVVAVQLRQLDPRTQTLAIGQPGAPPKGTSNAQFLARMEEDGHG